MQTPIRSIKNQYPGINAHLHSYWQAEHHWHRFHNYHIGQLMAGMKAQLLPMGYTAEMEESLQIRRFGDGSPQRPRADILIQDTNPQRTGYSGRYKMSAQAIALEELVEEDAEHPFFAVVIYERETDLAVAWIELLSPSNKGNNRDAYTYLAKRRLLLEKGLVFVEIDYLHESPSTFERLPDYSQHEAKAYPYHIIVIDPRPEYHQAQVYLHKFEVDSPIPTVEIPLNAGDILHFDFGAAYQKTLAEGLYGYEVDYAELPLNFDRYSYADQTRIARRMLAVMEAAQHGVDLETSAPLPVKEITLEDALLRIESLKTI